MSQHQLSRFLADLHIHTCLSPCGDLDMSPKKVVESSLQIGLNIIAICDHNCAANVSATKRAAKNTNLHVLGGMEVTSSEEVHLVTIFDNDEYLFDFEKLVLSSLPQEENIEDIFGVQAVADEFDNVERLENQLLLTATSLSIDQIIEQVHKRDGLVFPAHIDREAFGIISQLGFIPLDLPVDGLEVSFNANYNNIKDDYSLYSHFGFLTSSDAHYPTDLGRSYSEFLMYEPTVKEIIYALKGEGSRKVNIGKKLSGL